MKPLFTPPHSKAIFHLHHKRTPTNQTSCCASTIFITTHKPSTFSHSYFFAFVDSFSVAYTLREEEREKIFVPLLLIFPPRNPASKKLKLLFGSRWKVERGGFKAASRWGNYALVPALVMI